MGHLGALLPVAQGVAVWATLGREADAQVAAGDGRTRSQIMADTLVERVTGQATATAVPVAVNLTVSDQTLFAGGAEPAWVQHLGQVPAGTARDLVATATAQAHATLRRLYVTPATGRLVAMDSRSRAFPDALGLFIDLRDQTCRTPWCDAPIRHRDHVTPVTAGGPTHRHNGQGLCEACNYAKQAPGWRTRAHHGPGRHLVEITTPTGHRHRSRAPALPRPAPDPLTHPTPSRAEIYVSELVLAC
jgi:hypothetical protein